MKLCVLPVLLGGLLVASSGCVYVSGTINPFGRDRGDLRETTVSGSGRDKILLVNLSGMITGMERTRLLGLAREESTVARLREELRAARDDKRVKAVVLRIDSPGGGVTASDTIYSGIMRFREETQRPVIAVFRDVATSGAYYVALAADEIIASPTTITGSVGVILVGLNVEGLMTKLGIRDQTIKSGAHKDLLSPFRDATLEERALVQDVIDELHGRFLGLVSAQRPMVSKSDLDRITDGRILTASQAVDMGLVDRTGYVDDAIESAKQAAGVERARVVMYHRGGEYRENVYSGASLQPQVVQHPTAGGEMLSLTVGLPQTAGPRFMYLWVPGISTSR
jgi:protease-4